MMSDKTIALFMELEEKSFLLKKRLFELLKLSGEIDMKLEQIANETFYEEDQDGN